MPRGSIGAFTLRWHPLPARTHTMPCSFHWASGQEGLQSTCHGMLFSLGFRAGGGYEPITGLQSVFSTVRGCDLWFCWSSLSLLIIWLYVPCTPSFLQRDDGVRGHRPLCDARRARRGQSPCGGELGDGGEKRGPRREEGGMGEKEADIGKKKGTWARRRGPRREAGDKGENKARGAEGGTEARTRRVERGGMEAVTCATSSGTEARRRPVPDLAPLREFQAASSRANARTRSLPTSQMPAPTASTCDEG